MKISLMAYKTLIYYFYIDNDEYIMNFHLSSLKPYIKIFDNYIFILSINNFDDSYISNKKNHIISSLNIYGKDVEFRIVKNDYEYREGIHFYNEIICKLDTYDGLVYWGHNKTDSHIDTEIIKKWIAVSNYINLHNIEDVEQKLMLDDNYCLYGSMPTIENANTNSFFFNGSFYWLYPKKLLHKFNDRIDRFIAYIKNVYDNDYRSPREISQFRMLSEQWYNKIIGIENITSINDIITNITIEWPNKEYPDNCIFSSSIYYDKDYVTNNNILNNKEYEGFLKYYYTLKK